MAKRKSGSDEESPHRKRQKITENSLAVEDTVKIQSVQDLQLLLTFEQDAGSRVRQKILSFKLFLESITYGKESDERSSKRAVLLKYLQSQTSYGTEESSMYLPDIIQTWHFAVEANVETLCSSIAAVLALLLKAVSSSLEFRESGNQLCNLLLQDSQMKLFEKGLGTSRAKEHLISPCLRLLTEIVSFDGGHTARAVFRQREITFSRIEVFLSMRKSPYGGEADAREKPSVRNNALRYLYANLRLQTPAAKINILAQAKIVRALLEDVSADSQGVVLELLHVLKEDVALDDALSHHVKSRFFNEWSLSRLATLYGYDQPDRNDSGERKSVQESAHNFLLFLCTTPGHGVLDLPDQDALGIEVTEFDTADMTANERSPYETSHRGNQLKSRNARLSSFLQNLRPYASVLQSELILAVFRRAPALVSDYFTKKRNFFFDPKATVTWIGYSSFLLATIRLPLSGRLADPKVNGAPTISPDKVVDSVMPQTLTQKVLTRCLNQNTNLIKFLTIKILTAAFEKFQNVLRMYRSPHHGGFPEPNFSMQRQAALNLTTEFCSRVPDIEHVIAQFRSCPKSYTFLQQSLTCLLALYYRVLPHKALEVKLDISAVLLNRLQERPKEKGVHLLELDDMLAIAQCSPNMQWWHKSENMTLSPFTTLLELQVERERTNPRHQQLRTLLVAVTEEIQMLASNESMLSLDLLVYSLQKDGHWSPSKAVFEFLDNCILRFVRKPVHYYDLFSELVFTAENSTRSINADIDLLLFTVVEQWPFLLKSADACTITNVAMWLVRYIGLSSLRVAAPKHDRRAFKVLVHIRDQLRNNIEDERCGSMLDLSLKDPAELGFSIESVTSTGTGNNQYTAADEFHVDEIQSEHLGDFVPPRPPQEQEEHSGLSRWTRLDIQDAIIDGAIEKLFLCLCSRHAEIRQQAVTGIAIFMGKLESSGYKEWRQSYETAGELNETARDSVPENPLPSLAAVLAARLLTVVDDPLHFMYEKANKFLHRGPRWDVSKLASYWVDRILLKAPTDDESHYQEAEWLLDVLIEGLRTSSDFELYRSSNIIVRLLSFSASPSLPEQCFQKILELLFRCTYVEGSTTLITRCGLMRWISCRLAFKESDVVTKARLRTLVTRAYESSDQVRVDEWSDDSLKGTLATIRISENQ